MASVPATPSTVSTQDFSFTTESQIKVVFDSLESIAFNGGSPILGYDLWRDDGKGGDPVSLYGSKATTESILVLSYVDFAVAKGITYRYKYRARNINGWGDFS